MIEYMSRNEPGITWICDLQQVAPLYHICTSATSLWSIGHFACQISNAVVVEPLEGVASSASASCPPALQLGSRWRHLLNFFAFQTSMSPDVSRCLQMSPDVSRCLQMSPALCQCSTHLQLHGTLSISGLQAFITILLDGLDFAAETNHLASSGLRHEPDVPVHRQGLQYKHFGSPKWGKWTWMAKTFREKRWIEKANSSRKNADRVSYQPTAAQLVTRRLMRRSEYLILPQKIQTPAVASLVQCKKHRESELQTLFLCSTQCKQPG